MRVSRPHLSSLVLRPVILGLFVVALMGGQAAYSASARTVAVTVDGKVQKVTSHAGTVAEVLAAAHLTVGEHDVLAPALSTKVTDGVTILVRRGRQLTLTVDGKQRDVWVTALSVAEALDQIGLRTSGSVLSADRTREIPLKGFSLDVRTRKDVQLLDGGKLRHLVTNAVLVRDLVSELPVKVRSKDKLSLSGAAPVTDGMVLRLTRVDGHQVGEDVPVPFATEQRPDSSLYIGTSQVRQPGSVGIVHRVYALTFVNGKLAARKLVSSTETTKPVTKVVAVGTKQRPRVARSVAGADGLNWAALARCESGGNPRSVSSNGSYRGLYQFSMGTWRGVGGSGDPIDASSAEQTYRAKLLYRRAGRSPWPVCGRYL